MNALPPLDDLREQRLARYRAGAMVEAERRAFEAEALADDALAEALYSELSLDAVRREPAASRAARDARFAWWRVALPVAASLVAASAWWLWRSPSTAPVPDDGTVRGSGAMSALEPSGDVSAPPDSLRWTSAAGAASYRVELLDESGGAIGLLVTSDTVAAVASLRSPVPSAARWRVTAIGADGLDLAAKTHAEWRVLPR